MRVKDDEDNDEVSEDHIVSGLQWGYNDGVACDGDTSRRIAMKWEIPLRNKLDFNFFSSLLFPSTCLVHSNCISSSSDTCPSSSLLPYYPT